MEYCLQPENHLWLVWGLHECHHNNNNRSCSFWPRTHYLFFHCQMMAEHQMTDDVCISFAVLSTWANTLFEGTLSDDRALLPFWSLEKCPFLEPETRYKEYNHSPFRVWPDFQLFLWSLYLWPEIMSVNNTWWSSYANKAARQKTLWPTQLWSQCQQRPRHSFLYLLHFCIGNNLVCSEQHWWSFYHTGRTDQSKLVSLPFWMPRLYLRCRWVPLYSNMLNLNTCFFKVPCKLNSYLCNANLLTLCEIQ